MIARLASVVAIAVFAAGCSTAEATTPNETSPDYTCSFTHPSKSVATLKKLPKPLRAYIKAKVGGIADRDEFFNAGDVVTKPGPFNRFIRGGTIAGKYFLWYEHGGFAYWKQIVLLNHDGTVAAEEHGNDAGGLCARTDALIDTPAKP